MHRMGAKARSRRRGTATVVRDRRVEAPERYRERFGVDPEFVEADRIRDESGCVRRYERTFMRPLLPASR